VRPTLSSVVWRRYVCRFLEFRLYSLQPKFLCGSKVNLPGAVSQRTKHFPSLLFAEHHAFAQIVREPWVTLNEESVWGTVATTVTTWAGSTPSRLRPVLMSSSFISLPIPQTYLRYQHPLHEGPRKTFSGDDLLVISLKNLRLYPEFGATHISRSRLGGVARDRSTQQKSASDADEDREQRTRRK
jgi:hypothetical protein